MKNYANAVTFSARSMDPAVPHSIRVELDGTLTDLGTVHTIRMFDEGVVLFAGDRWVLIPWHRVTSVEGPGASKDLQSDG